MFSLRYGRRNKGQYWGKVNTEYKSQKEEDIEREELWIDLDCRIYNRVNQKKRKERLSEVFA